MTQEPQRASESTAPAGSTAYRVREAVAAIRTRTALEPRVALILGSGLSSLADELADPVLVPYDAISNFPVPTVQGHPGQLVLGTLDGVPAVAMKGRVHFYEGNSLAAITFPVRVMRKLGAEILIATNAAGGLNETFSSGDLMVLTDHVNLMGMAGLNPLVGLHEPELGVRFLDMLAAYDADLRALALDVAEEHGFALRQGVYAMIAGPSYETMAEIRFLQRIGADAVGMSTVPEVIVARHEKMRVLALSAITDMAVGVAAESQISHQAVLDMAERIRPRLAAIVRGVVGQLV